MKQRSKTPTVLLILDGWGHREEKNDNAIANGNTPVWDRLWKTAPHTLISSSGLDVGLPAEFLGIEQRRIVLLLLHLPSLLVFGLT